MKNLNLKSTQGQKIRTVSMNVIVFGSLLVMGIAEVSAARGGGGGGRGGYSGGGGGKMANSSVSSSNRGMGGGQSQNRPSGGNNANRPNNGGNNNIGSGNNNNINTGNNNNINIDRNTNINIDGGYHGGGYNNNCCYHGGVRYPVAAGITIGAMAVTRAAVIGSYYYALPPSCTTVYRANVKYYYCGSVYYQQSWSGNDVVYIVVNP